MHVQFLRLFTRVKVGEVYDDSLIAFAKVPWMYQSRALSPEEIEEKGYMVEHTCIQYRYKIYVNLYVVRFYLSFLWPRTLSVPEEYPLPKDFPIHLH